MVLDYLACAGFGQGVYAGVMHAQDQILERLILLKGPYG